MRFDRADKYVTVTVIDYSSRNDTHFEKPFSQDIFLCYVTGSSVKIQRILDMDHLFNLS